ncbi:hypothetical protein KVR01_008575 [Diaporthe batatas]|uniref:uncharacterized protein n=1 Tax=Diaporthe batatas TaxID=748121 RepID=UPI001D03C73D|nr:uncharacterized protein KVR01_008575 [Diaporthe batatas]KAG8161588.1 hypothetical protein KVR01_008575 [Diaporthe batatas]
MNILKIFLCLLGTAGATTHVGGNDRFECYVRGPIFSDMKAQGGGNGNIDEAIADFCHRRLPEQWGLGPGQRIRHCFPFPQDNTGNKLEIEIKNTGKARAEVDVGDCEHALRWLRDHCWWGGHGEHRGFEYDIDPNFERC